MSGSDLVADTRNRVAQAGRGGDADVVRRNRRDLEIVAGLAALFFATRVFHGAPWWLGVAMLAAGLIRVSPKGVAIAVLVLMGTRAGHVVESLDAAASGPLSDAAIVLVSDPRPADGGWTAQGKLGVDRVFLNVRVSAGPEFGDAAVGDTVLLSGTLRGSAPETPWAISRRIVGSVSVTNAAVLSSAGGVTGAANGLRTLYADGARSLDLSDQALFRGLVFGDDRGQDPIDADNFRAAGLGHLLAVSGQNVAFVLLLAAPALGRIPNVAVRVLITVMVLLGFGVLTRFEASVSRALVMAGCALIAHAVGRESSAGVVLLPAVGGLLVYDPLLAWSLAFQLSVFATVGMIVLAPRLAELLPGPEVFAKPAAATLGAQLFVAPLLLSTFGRLSPVALPANLLAGPAAAAVMMWGLVAGPIAGLVPEPVAEVVHVPTLLLIRWIVFVAERSAAMSVGFFSFWHLAALCGGLVAFALARRTSRPVLGRVGGGLIIIALGTAIAISRPLPPGMHELGNGISVARSSHGTDVVILRSGVSVGDALEEIRAANLGRIDLVISTSGSRQMGVVIHSLRTRFEILEVWAPEGHQVAGAMARNSLSGSVGSLAIEHDPSTHVVSITERAGGGSPQLPDVAAVR